MTPKIEMKNLTDKRLGSEWWWLGSVKNPMRVQLFKIH